MAAGTRISAHLWVAVVGLLTVGCSSTALRPQQTGTTKEATVAKMEFSMSAERANDPRLEPLRYLERYGKEHPPELAFEAKDEAAWRRWRRDLRKRLHQTIGLPGMDDSGRSATEPRKLRVTAGPVEQCDGYKRMAFTIETGPGLYVPAFLLVPDGLKEPRPAILCSHGHGIGMNDLVALNEKGESRPYKEGYHHDFAIQAVKAGFVALAFDQMGFGRRRDIDFHKQQNMWNHCEQPSKNALHWGLSMTGIRVWDAMRMIDFLQSRPEVDDRSIGMVGISGGGLVTQFTSALDDRVKAACVSGYLSRYEACILSIHHCIDNYVPGLGRLANDDDIACLIAPRPLLIEAGRKDPIFPIATTEEAIRKLRRCYKVAGAPDVLETDIFDGPHEFSGARTWTFFAEHLGQ
jgi:dienelactone hydrolase